jgi:formylmethanofuran dehydrogenase subunit B
MTTGRVAAAERVVRSATCLGCGCTCDDIDVVVRDGLIADARNACTLGLAWFGDGCLPARVRVSGADATVDAALDAAALLLTRATRPLVYLAPDISCEAQREGVAIADVLRAALDGVTSSGAMASLLASQERGRASATLGQVKNFADVLVFWGVDPSLRYPRYLSRYAAEPSGLRTPDGRRSRTVIAVDIENARGPADADLRIALTGAEEVATLTALTAMVSGGGQQSQAYDGPWARARELAPPLLAGRYVTFVADAETEGAFPDRDPGRSAALIAMTQALNGPTRCALSLLRAGGNRTGADAVLTWQTGYPAAIDFTRGHPRYRPYDGTALARLTRAEVDGALILGSSDLVSADILTRLAHVPCAVIGPRASDGPAAQRDVVIDTGIAGIHEGGTAIRMDDVPLLLRPALDGLPAAADMARALKQRVASARWAARG